MISDEIKQRLKERNVRFHSNDNISEHIAPYEVELLQEEVEQKFKAVLDSLVIDTENDHNTNETAKRVAKMYVQEIFGGRYKPVPKIQDSQVEAAAELINNAQRPLIVWGQGIILGEAEAQLKEMIEKTGIPAAWTIMGASALPTSHPLNVGMVGMHGNYAPNVLTNECDVLIAIGMRFDDRVTGNLNTYAKQAKVIHFEIDPAEIDKNVKTDLAVLGDAK